MDVFLNVGCREQSAGSREQGAERREQGVEGAVFFVKKRLTAEDAEKAQ